MNEFLTELAAYLGRDAAVVRATAAMLGILLVGSVVRVAVYLAGRRAGAGDRFRSLATWWAVAAILVAVVAIGPAAMLVLMVVVSGLAMHEYLVRILAAAAPRPLAMIAYALIAVQYGCIGWGAVDLALMILPTLGVIALIVGTLAAASVGRYLATAGPMVLGVMLLVYLPSFTLMLPTRAPHVDPLAPVLALLWLAMTHDIAAALVGRSLGKRRVLPTISPGKTWAGVAGGFAAGAVLGALLGPSLLGATWPAGVAAGLVVATGAFVGDATLSALKRDRGLKDSGRLLPGQGGMLDRIDSLSVAAPLLFIFLHLLW